jgi:hypothetical protein
MLQYESVLVLALPVPDQHLGKEAPTYPENTVSEASKGPHTQIALIVSRNIF